MLKTCDTCGYASGKFDNWGKCRLTGFYCATQRTFPDKNCDINFSGWVPKEKGWFARLFGKEEECEN
jgi:hypothetical protein